MASGPEDNLVSWLFESDVAGVAEAVEFFQAVGFPWFVAIQESRNLIELFEGPSHPAIVARWLDTARSSVLALEVSIYESALTGHVVYNITHPKPGHTSSDFYDAVRLCRAHLNLA
jgi:hypothetical protein